jgi:hypothetical protein
MLHLFQLVGFLKIFFFSDSTHNLSYLCMFNYAVCLEIKLQIDILVSLCLRIADLNISYVLWMDLLSCEHSLCCARNRM